MSTALAEAPAVSATGVNLVLLDAIVNSTAKALSMCSLEARCVGASRVPTHDTGVVTGLIGVHGSVSGFVNVNMSEQFAVNAVSKLMDVEGDSGLSPMVVDGAGELTNMIAGGIKANLAGSEWAFSQITVPSMIVGHGYSIAYARGLEFLTATFEHEESDSVMLADRLLHVSVSLLRT